MDHIIEFFTTFSKAAYVFLLFFIISLNILVKFAVNKNKRINRKIDEIRERIKEAGTTCAQCDKNQDECGEYKFLLEAQNELKKLDKELLFLGKYFVKPILFLFINENTASFKNGRRQ